jgi:hypothetical protein
VTNLHVRCEALTLLEDALLNILDFKNSHHHNARETATRRDGLPHSLEFCFFLPTLLIPPSFVLVGE